MKYRIQLIQFILGSLFMILSFQLSAQSCENVANFDDQPLGVLAPYGGFPSYFNDYGSPEYVVEGCPVGTGSQGVRLQASIDGSVGGGLGYTETGGINPMPTFTTGTTYHIAGKKLYSEISAGAYNDIVMKIRLSNFIDNGLNCNSPDCVILIEKTLMLTEGVCESWDPPYEFVSPGDFSFMIISIEAFSESGDNDLFIVIDDWCVEEVPVVTCVPEFEFFQEDCGKIQFTNLSTGSTFIQWNIIDPDNNITAYDEENPCIFFTLGGTYSVSLIIQCEDGSLVTSDEFLFEIVQNLPPFFENCNDGQLITIEGEYEDMICVGNYTFPQINAFDDGNPISPTCTFDGLPALPGQVFTRPTGIYTIICTIQDECSDPQICFFQVEIVCELDEPCEYTCCEDGPNWPVEGFTLGSLPQSVPSGYYPEYGDPQVINDGCDGSIQGIELKGTSLGNGGDAVGIRNNGIPPIPLFVKDNTYCISFCMKIVGGNTLSAVLDLQASNVAQTDNSCSGSCEIIGASNLVNQSDGWTQQQIIYTPTADYDNFLMINADSGFLDWASLIIIDNVCISIAEPIYCKADFTIEDQGCGKMLFTAENCGDVESILWLWDDGFESFESSDTSICQEYPTTGPWTVNLIITCQEGIIDTVIKTFFTSGDTIPPMITCPNDTIIYLGDEVECFQEYFVGYYLIDDPSATVTCYQSGFPIADPTVPIILQEGLTEIKYIAQDTCGNIDSCSYTIILNCDPVIDPKYDCPIDVLFVMDNSGSIDDSEYNNMAISALAEINAISGIYSNSKFGIVHYSGLCGDKISIEHDFSSASTISAISRQFSTIYPGIMDDLNESIDAVINALNGAPDPDILSGTLTPDPLASLYIVIFTDGAPFVSQFPGGCTNSSLKPYTNANILKNTLNANISVVHFIPSFADAECAAIASQGGTWTGAVDANPGDPSNPLGPRQYIPATFSTPNIDLLTILPPCEPCYDCEDLEVSFEETNADSCCYSIDIVNGIGSDVVKLEAEIISPDWQFNTASTNPGSGYKWYPSTTPTSNKVCITGAGNVIPLGANPDVLEYCFSEATSSPSGPQIVVFRWYTLLNDTLFEMQCTDTIVTECIPVVNDPCITINDIEIDCNEDNAYEYIVNITVTNTSGFNASHITLGGIDPGFLFANCPSGIGVPTLSIPILGGLANGNSTTQCFKIISPNPILNPKLICFDIGIYSFFECCHSPEPICITIDPCCDPCEDITTTYSTLSVPNEDQCCYTLEIDYGCDYLFFDKIKVNSVTPGVTFGYHALGNPSWQMCGSSPIELCVKPNFGLISKGNYPNLLDICFDEINDVSQIPQTVRIDYITIDPSTNSDSVACSQELIFECEIVNNKCLEITDQDLVCIPDSSKYRYTFTVTNKSSLPFNATDVDVFIFSPTGLYFDPSGGTFPLTPPLGSNQSQTITTCIKSYSSFPAVASEIILGYRLRFNDGDTCCYESVYDTIPFPPCGEEVCCSDEEDFLNSIAQGFLITDLGDCTYQVCANQFDTCHWFGTLGPDWGDGTGAPSAIIQSNPPNNCWTHTYTQSGPHKVTMHVFEGDLPNNEICWDADLCSYIDNECPDTSGCFSVVDIEMKGIVCDTTDCYENPFCQSWLVDEISNVSCFGISGGSVDKAIYNGQTVFIIKQFYLDLSETRIYTCDGTLIQSCYWTVPPPVTPCNPDAGIDITTDLSNVVQIWDCNDPLPTYDPLDCILSGNTVVDYCVKIMNNYPSSTANNIDLQSIAPVGVTVSPATFSVNIPTGGMATINFSISGSLFAGDIVKLEGLLSGINEAGEEFECTDAICLEVPPCPIEECCIDEEEFNTNIAKGFTVTQLGDCTYQVCANQFDTCHWFSNPAPDWGDGSVNLQVLAQSNPPNNCWTHTYAQSGTFKISLGVSEINSTIGEPCWGGLLCSTIETDCCSEDPCDNVNIIAEPVSTSVDSCCYDFTIENNFCDDFFKGIRIEVNAQATISQIQGLNGYVINQLSNSIAEVRPLFGFISVGSKKAFRLCNNNYATNPHLLTISWLVPGPNDTCEEICPSEFEIGCEIDPPFDKKCFEIVDDSIHCESDTYCFKIKNVSQPAFDINSVDLYDLSGSLGFTPSGRITIPTLTSGNTSDWICVQYFGTSAGDNVCYKLSAHNTPANLPPTTCCTDTIETCFTITECDSEACAGCPAGTTQGQNLIQNGDFEIGSGYSGGWYSGYDLKLVGLMGSNDYSIRNSTNLVNSQWQAVDHTNNNPSGNFLALDGPSSNIAYGVTINVKPNTDYVFCMWVDNLVRTSTSSAPIIRVDIGSTNVLSGQLLPKNPDGWQLITINYNSGSNSGLVDIKVRDISTTYFNDWAIDDVSFIECTVIEPPCCADLDTTAICDYYNANITLSRNECEGCVFVNLDSCDIGSVDFGNGPVPIQDNIAVCNMFNANGNYTFTVTIQRFNENDSLCFEKEFVNSIFIEECTPISAGTCISLIDGALDCENGEYCFKVVNNTANPGFSFASIALINESAGHTFNPDPISLGNPIMPGDTSGIICVTYLGANQGDDVCFDLVGHKEDLAAGDEPTFCCADTVRYCFIDTCSTFDPCCDITDKEMCDFLDIGIDYTLDQCNLCLPFEVDSCMVIKVDFGDGNMSESTGGGEICRMYEGPGTYAINVRLERFAIDGSICMEKDTTFEAVVDCPSPGCDVNDLDIFNAITPNNDGLNDVLVIDGEDDCPRDIKIFNRWGQMVWSEKDYNNGWKGQSFNGENLPNGTYFLIVEYPFVDSKEKRMFQTFIDIRDN